MSQKVARVRKGGRKEGGGGGGAKKVIYRRFITCFILFQ